jgi:hypothetical protein
LAPLNIALGMGRRRMFKQAILFTAGLLIGLVGASYLFILNGYRIEAVSSERFYRLVKSGKIPISTLHQSEIRSNGHALEVFGTVENHSPEPIRMGKVSADLFDGQSKFIHKCEHWIQWLRKSLSTTSDFFAPTCSTSSLANTQRARYT